MKMPIQPKPMKVQCPQCHAMDIFMPKSDVFAFFPTCKKCGVQMVTVGKAGVVDWVGHPIRLLQSVIKTKNY